MALVLRNLSIETLANIADARGYICERKRPTKENYIGILLPDITEEGVRQFVHSLQVKELKVWTKKITKDVLSSQNVNNPRSASVMKKRLAEQINEEGVDRYMARLNPKEDALKAALKRMGVEMEGTREEMKNALMAEIDMYGAEAFFNQFNVETLKYISEELKLTIASSSKPVLVRCIVSLENYTPPPRPPRKKKELKKVRMSTRKTAKKTRKTRERTMKRIRRRKAINQQTIKRTRRIIRAI